MPRPRSLVAQRTAAADTFRGQIIALLGDGKPRDAQTILDEAANKTCSLRPPRSDPSTRICCSYIQQEAAKGRKPAVVEDPISRKVRANHPVDDWPAVALPPHPG